MYISKRILGIGLLLIGISCSSYAFYCGNSLIQEGQNIATVIQACGQPTSQYNGYITYNNLNGAGMNYTLHIDNDGTIENITYERQ